MVVMREQNRQKLGHVLIWNQNDIDLIDIPRKEAQDRMCFIFILNSYMGV